MFNKFHPGMYLSRDMAVLALLLLVVFGLNLAIPRDLWVQDEARYGEVVREMLASGQWLVAHLNGHPYPDKPPLYFWLVALLGSVIGHGETAFRLVSFGSTALATAGVYLTARALTGASIAFWSSAIFVTSFLTLVVGQIVRMDMLLTAASVFSWYAVLRFLQTNKQSGVWLFWSLCALAIAIKGPIALLFTLLPGMVWISIERGWRGLWELRPLLGLLFLVAMVAIWISAVIGQGHAEYLRTIWHEQLVGRTINSWSHKEPFYFYILLAPILLMPWFALVMHGGQVLYKNRPLYWRAVALFSLLPLIGISLISGKLFIYMEPLVPALSIAAGVSALQLAQRTTVSRWFAWPPLVFLFLILGGMIWLVFSGMISQVLSVTAIAAALFVLIGVGYWLGRVNGLTWISGWMAISALVSWLIFGVLIAVLNPLFSPRAIGEAIARLAPSDTPVGIVHATRGILNYYAQRTYTELSPSEAAVWWQQHPQALLVIKTPEIETVFGAQGLPATCKTHEIYKVELKEYHVLVGC